MKRIVFLGVLSCFGVGMLAANTAFAADLLPLGTEKSGKSA